MPKKRRNGGRNKKNKGRALCIRCDNCQRMCGKDKAIKRFVIKNIVDASSKRDIEEASAYLSGENPMPKLYMKNQWCVACAIHKRTVRVRSTENKRVRFVSKVRKGTELGKLYKVANRKFVVNNPFANEEKEEM